MISLGTQVGCANMSQEKIRSCKFKILNAQLADDVVLRGGGLLAS